MYLTEEQAATKICPFQTIYNPHPTIFIGRESGLEFDAVTSPGYIEPIPGGEVLRSGAPCQGSRCMMWQWLTGVSIQKGRCVLTAGS